MTNYMLCNIVCTFQGTASEATLVALLGAKAKIIQRVKEQHPTWSDYEIVSKLVGYCSGKCCLRSSQLLNDNIFLITIQTPIVYRVNYCYNYEQSLLQIKADQLLAIIYNMNQLKHNHLTTKTKLVVTLSNLVVLRWGGGLIRFHVWM